MTDAAVRNIIASEFRALQARMQQQVVTKSDLNALADRILAYTAAKRDQDIIRQMVEEVRMEVRSQRQAIKQHSAYIENLSQSARNNTTQLGTLWRLVQQ